MFSLRALNRALLSRQLMLDQADLPQDRQARRATVIRAIEHLVGLQAQAPFRDDQGAELFDLPSAPRPDPGVPAPVRLAAEFDNLMLAHADRTRVVSAANLKRFYTVNGVFPGPVLVDGFVAGLWRLARSKRSATLAIELFGPVPDPDRDLLVIQAARMLAFCAPEAAHEIRFSPA